MAEAGEAASPLTRSVRLLDAALTFLLARRLACRVALCDSVVRSLLRGAAPAVPTLDLARLLARAAPQLLSLAYVPEREEVATKGGEEPLVVRAKGVVYHLEVVLAKQFAQTSKAKAEARLKLLEAAVAAAPTNAELGPLPAVPGKPVLTTSVASAASTTTSTSSSSSSSSSTSRGDDASTSGTNTTAGSNASTSESSSSNSSSSSSISNCSNAGGGAIGGKANASNRVDIDSVLASLQSSPFYEAQVVHTLSSPARPKRTGALQHAVHPALKTALQEALHISELFAHQSVAIDAALEGRDVVVSTATSSGKSLIFNVPVLQSFLSALDAPAAQPELEAGGFVPELSAAAERTERPVTALYIFPTKALAQDQLGTCTRLADAIARVCGVRARVRTFDGDTDGEALRNEAREQADVLITNPDMLHVTLLPSHAQWEGLLRSLRFVVVDEAHSYSGPFGSHVAMVLRRLLRVCSLYGATPQFFCLSATIGNPLGLYQALVGANRPATLVGEDQDGSACGRRNFILWQPPLVSRGSRAGGGNSSSSSSSSSAGGDGVFAEQARKSAIFETALVLSALVRRGVKTIAFCRTRKLTELVLRYTQDELRTGYKGKVYSGKARKEAPAPELASLVAAYRGGYQVEERRRLETQLFAGQLLAVTATSALELGIDLGYLDCVLLLGYPGSASSLWQQVGRAGRGGRDALAILVCFDGPLDQYFCKCPQYLWDRSRVEDAVVDARNKYALKDHLLCAAHEAPLAGAELEALFGAGAQAALGELGQDGLVERLPQWDGSVVFRTHSKVQRPARSVSLRTIDPVSFEIYHEDRLMDSIPYSRSLFEVYPGAIYMHQGQSFLVSRLDLNTYKAFAYPTNVQYFTAPRDSTRVNILNRIESRRFEVRGGSGGGGGTGCWEAHSGNIEVVSRVWGFRKMWLRSGRVFEMHEFTLPNIQFETLAVWVDISLEVLARMRQQALPLNAAVHAVNHLMCRLAPLFVVCASSAVACEHTAEYFKAPQPARLLLFDRVPGGIGVAEAVFAHIERLLGRCLELARGCGCDAGCPACVISPSCGEFNNLVEKRAAVALLEALLEPYEPVVAGAAAPAPAPAPTTGTGAAAAVAAETGEDGGAAALQLPADQLERALELADAAEPAHKATSVSPPAECEPPPLPPALGSPKASAPPQEPEPAHSAGKKRKPPGTPQRKRAWAVKRAMGLGRARVEQIQIATDWTAHQPNHDEGMK